MIKIHLLRLIPGFAAILDLNEFLYAEKTWLDGSTYAESGTK